MNKEILTQYLIIEFFTSETVKQFGDGLPAIR